MIKKVVKKVVSKKKKVEPISIPEMAKMGGDATLKKYGVEHYRKMVNKRWKNARAKKRVGMGK